jgi:hypothetical protein
MDASNALSVGVSFGASVVKSESKFSTSRGERWEKKLEICKAMETLNRQV